LTTRGTEDRYVTLIKMSVLTSIVTALLLWFFEPSFVQVHVELRSHDIDKNTHTSVNYNTYTSKTLILMWSVLAGLFAFSVLYSIPE
jgi:hypothetical protein